MTRRIVRVDPSFFEDLDSQLPAERGPNGEPSATDFLVIDLPTIVDEFAERFDELAVVTPGREDYRVLMTTGTLVAAALVVGRLTPGGAIVLIAIDLDPNWPDET